MFLQVENIDNKFKSETRTIQSVLAELTAIKYIHDGSIRCEHFDDYDTYMEFTGVFDYEKMEFKIDSKLHCELCQAISLNNPQSDIMYSGKYCSGFVPSEVIGEYVILNLIFTEDESQGFILDSIEPHDIEYDDESEETDED